MTIGPRYRARLALLLALVLVSGHTAGLQILAWSGMLVARLQTSSVEQAIRSTFDGSTPCRLCLAVSALEKADVAAGQAPDKPTKPSKQDSAPDMIPMIIRQPTVAARQCSATLTVTDWSIPKSAIVDVESPPPQA